MADTNEVIDGGLEILKYPNPVLKKTSEPVTVFDEDLAKFVQDMFAGSLCGNEGT